MHKGTDRVVQSAKQTRVRKPESTRKRVTRACDECRLHKAKCNGQHSCETCLRNGRVCSYNLIPSESQGSAARIRILEHRLSRARECITALQRQVPYIAVADTTEILAPQTVIHSVHPSLGPVKKHSNETHAGTHFITSLLQPITDHNLQAMIQSQTTRIQQLDHSTTANQWKIQFCQLPSFDTALEAIYASFHTVFGLCNIVCEQRFRQSMHRLYNINPIAYTAEDTNFRLLFYAVLALGMLSCVKIHDDLGYEKVIRESSLYFRAANTTVSTLHASSPVLEVQTRLCLLLYSLNTSNLHHARSALERLCELPIVCRLFQSVPSLEPGDLSFDATTSKDTIWMIYYVDMYISSFTQTIPLLKPPGEEMATIHTINTAAYNAAHYIHSPRSLLSSTSLAMAIELLRLTRCINTGDAGIDHSVETLIAPKRSENDGGLKSWNELKIQLEVWERCFRCSFHQDENDAQVTLARDELQLLFYVTQIKLCHQSLHSYSQRTTPNTLSGAEEQEKGRVCVSAAVHAISYTSTRLQYAQAQYLSCGMTYAVYISALVLLLACGSADAEEFNALQHSVNVAATVLQATTSSDPPSKAEFLNTIQTISTKLSVDLHFIPSDNSSPSMTFYSAPSEFSIST